LNSTLNSRDVFYHKKPHYYRLPHPSGLMSLLFFPKTTLGGSAFLLSAIHDALLDVRHGPYDRSS
jgi:hypothetical protein